MSNLHAALRAAATGLAMLAAVGAFGGSSMAEDIRVNEEKFGQMVRDYLLKHPEVLREVIDALEKKEKATESTGVDRSDQDPCRGNLPFG